MKNERNQTTLKNKLGDANDVKIICQVSEKGTIERLFYNPSTDQYETTGTGANNFLNDFLPKLQFVKTETSLKEVAKYGSKTEIGQMLAGVVNEILASEDPEYRDFISKFNELFVGENSKVSQQLGKISKNVEGYLRKQFTECEEVEFEVKSPKFDDLLKNFETNVDDGHKTTADEKGDGMQRALMLAIIQAYADFRKENEKIKNFIFLIDEAELHLHPTAQRSLKDALIELSNREDQVLITSHSSVLIADESEHQKIFKVEKIDKITDVKPVKEAEKPSIVYDLLGGNPADLLLPRNFMLVEGSSDKTFIDHVVQRFYSEEKQIQVIPIWGDVERADRVFDYLGSIFAPLNRSLYQNKIVILLDKISDERQNAFKDFMQKYPELNKNKDNQILELEVGSLEEYYPEGRASQVGGHNQATSWRRETGHALQSQQKHSLARHVGSGIEKEQFETDMPLIHDALKKCWANAY